MNPMRHLINLFESQKISEIEVGGYVDPPDYMSDYDNRDAHPEEQGELFPELPSIQLPKGFERVGTMGKFIVSRKEDGKGKEGIKYTYVFFYDGKPASYIATIGINDPFGGGYRIINPPLLGDGLRVISIWVNPTHRGQKLGIQMYEWLLKNVCDYILPDETHTYGGVNLWKQMLNRRNKFDVLVWDYEKSQFRRRWAGKDFAQIYNTNHLIPFVTLAGKSKELED